MRRYALVFSALSREGSVCLAGNDPSREQRRRRDTPCYHVPVQGTRGDDRWAPATGVEIADEGTLEVPNDASWIVGRVAR